MSQKAVSVWLCGAVLLVVYRCREGTGENNYVGMVSRRYLLNTQKKKIILVDYNEETQTVDGIGEYCRD